MERRQLFSNIFGLGARGVSPVAPNFMVEGGIEPHTEPLTRDDVYHLLRRMGFGATHEQAETFIGKTAAEVVDQLLGLDNEPAPESPGAWVDVWTEDPQGADLQTRFAIWKSWDLNMQKLANWWLEKMTGDETAVEKITLFWTSHWVSEFEFDTYNKCSRTPEIYSCSISRVATGIDSGVICIGNVLSVEHVQHVSH